ncbi:uncharacterized protein DSM5745_05954 [Aspergillus mulundensis]|uniref:Carboxylesterase type B domain-containing protein n=1 Tax=Aspergillus mulundensis TaxID=1810919 RepID=A0A3D8RYH6_9EURO|nr:hypothetical protein DSM5745_05954 [Aspergillus mulundensis]RDW79102.1 hypothetical protein DSM5745_05954 [Aspergillus mulundensis]
MLSTTVFYLLPLAALATAAPTKPSSPDLTIRTTSGLVHGIYNDTAHNVRAFLGIPYAEPPTGDLRFAPPQPKSPSSSPIDASAFGPPCPQVYSYNNESIWSVLPYRIWNAQDMSEDCLRVNVWTPTSHVDSQDAEEPMGKGKAVMLFIHGGGFGEGAGSVGFYDGVDLAGRGDVVVVTFNYRLNIFGYPNAPGLEASEQNVGLLDQRLAIEWVHRNIANFGGDPDRILLFGQSAGAASVDGYTYAYPDDPLVSAFVLQSGTVSLLNNVDPAHSNWNRLSTVIGCGTGTESLACMRSVPFTEILGALGNGSYTFTPVVDNRTVFADYRARARSGGQSRLPTLAGVNAREFSAGFPLSQTSINETAVTEDLYGSFSCPAYEAVKTRLNHHIPTWRYVYHGNFTNLSPRPWLGAYHSAELPILFGTYNQTTLPPPPSKNEMDASKYFQGAWVAFAKDPHTGLTEYGWPRFSFNERTLVNLAVGNKPGAVLSSAGKWDGHCDGETHYVDVFGCAGAIVWWPTLEGTTARQETKRKVIIHLHCIFPPLPSNPLFPPSLSLPLSLSPSHSHHDTLTYQINTTIQSNTLNNQRRWLRHILRKPRIARPPIHTHNLHKRIVVNAVAADRALRALHNTGREHHAVDAEGRVVPVGVAGRNGHVDAVGRDHGGLLAAGVFVDQGHGAGGRLADFEVQGRWGGGDGGCQEGEEGGGGGGEELHVVFWGGLLGRDRLRLGLDLEPLYTWPTFSLLGSGMPSSPLWLVQVMLRHGIPYTTP